MLAAHAALIGSGACARNPAKTLAKRNAAVTGISAVLQPVAASTNGARCFNGLGWWWVRTTHLKVDKSAEARVAALRVTFKWRETFGADVRLAVTAARIVHVGTV